MRKDKQVSPLMLRLSNYVAAALKRKLPEAVAERAKLHLVDTFAAMISGSRLLPGKRAIAYVKPLAGTQEAGVMGARVVTTALNAALANGMCGHADETDDTHPPTRSHFGTSVVPAALAIAERQQLSGESLLRAIVLGYDIGARTLLALKQDHLRETGHTPASFGALFGSAAAAGALLKLGSQQCRYMFSYCAQQTAGLYMVLRDSEHIEKAYAVGGMPAHNGLAAALMVSRGFTGVDDVLSGELDFLSVFSPNADRLALVRGLGRDYEILRSSIKYWPAGGPIQGPLHVLYDLIRQHAITADKVAKLVARMPDKELKVVNNRDMPDIAVQHLLAVMLLDGTVTFATAHDYARMRDPRVLRLRRRIEAIGDPSLTDPLRRWRCIMEITLKDGRKLTHQTMAAKGTYQNPLTRQEAEEKALGLIVPILGKPRSHELITTLYDINRLKDTRTLRTLYTAKQR